MRTDYTFVEGARFAWELIQTISDMSREEREFAFGDDSIESIIWDNSVSEVSDMLDRYNELMEIEVGTEVKWTEDGNMRRGIIIDFDDINCFGGMRDAKMTVLSYAEKHERKYPDIVTLYRDPNQNEYELTDRCFNNELSELITKIEGGN